MTPSVWGHDEYGLLFIRGRDCQVRIDKRPHYCDRGNFLAYLDVDWGSELARDIDAADLWPRFYFDEGRARLEIEAWLKKRGQWVDHP